MEEFEVPVTYKGKDMIFNGKLATFSYGYKLYVDVNGIEVIIERDDHGDLRALLPDAASEKDIDKGLIEAIIEVFKELQVL
ncbi:hypothetical protein C8D70_101104 [Chryseobacterium sp. CBTAP 102]|uniref:hypothetical protein n=1 Tax=unclassified Chryseobacterium TaxID=2593645 RepID=UPI0009560F8D|nr:MULTISPECIES: hypothetical protein [unclassified Chryseobacterium]PXW17782.1 hypothetical protein C8D70_101104 [Chryseobacterium sp. CBTAP 102]SIR60527.1 hypothetical protein SAMN05880573_12918 [Chryseobacterium sp. RU33C]